MTPGMFKNSSLGNTKQSVINEAGGRPKSDSPNLVEQLDMLRARRAHRIKTNRAEKRQEIVDACDLGVALMADEEMWREFCERDWTDIRNPPNLNERHKAVPFAIKYICGPGDDAQKDASFYFCAVDDLVQLGILGDELRDMLKRHGFRKLNAQHRARKKANALPPTEKKAVASTVADQAAKIKKQFALMRGEKENRFSEALPFEQRWERDHPTRFWFDVKFPFDPAGTFEEPLPDTFILYVKVTEFGEKCSMEVLKFQKHKEAGRIGHRF